MPRPDCCPVANPAACARWPCSSAAGNRASRLLWSDTVAPLVPRYASVQQLCFFNIYLENFQNTAKPKEFCSELPQIHHLDSTTNILWPLLFFHIKPSLRPVTRLFLLGVKVSSRHQYVPPRYFSMLVIEEFNICSQILPSSCKIYVCTNPKYTVIKS